MEWLYLGGAEKSKNIEEKALRVSFTLVISTVEWNPWWLHVGSEDAVERECPDVEMVSLWPRNSLERPSLPLLALCS